MIVSKETVIKWNCFRVYSLHVGVKSSLLFLTSIYGIYSLLDLYVQINFEDYLYLHLLAIPDWGFAPYCGCDTTQIFYLIYRTILIFSLYLFLPIRLAMVVQFGPLVVSKSWMNLCNSMSLLILCYLSML